MRNYIDSFNCAVRGILSALKTEKHMRLHFFATVGTILVSLFFDFSRLEFIALSVSIAFVLVSEMLNTAIEKLVDLNSKDYHPLARTVKDIAAGAVLIASVNAVVVGYLLFFDRITHVSEYVLSKIRNSPPHLTFVALTVVIVAVLALKAKCSKGYGTYFRGGSISGHSAVAFLMVTVITFLTKNILVSTLAFFLGFLVASSRVEGGIHTAKESFLGAILGLLTGVLIFQIFG